MKRRSFAAAVALCLIFAGLFVAAFGMTGVCASAWEDTEEKTGEPEQGNDRFLVTIQYGIDSLVKFSASIPVQISITNMGKDFIGDVTLNLVRGYSVSTGYGRELSIAAGETKTLTITIPPNSANFENCLVRIRDEKKRVQYERTLLKDISEFLYQNDNYCFVGVLSDDYASLNYLDNTDVSLSQVFTESLGYTEFASSGSTDENTQQEEVQYAVTSQNPSTVTAGIDTSINLKLAKLTEKTMPDSAEGLSMCNLIIIDNYDTGKLSDTQYKALRQWVESGGVLIVGTGSEYNKTLAKFTDDFISGSVGSLSKKNVNVFSNIGDQLNMDVLDLQLKDGVNVDTVTNSELFSCKYLGLGGVIVSKIGLGMEPFRSYSERTTVLGAVLSNVTSLDTDRSIMNTLEYRAVNASTTGDYYINTSWISSVNRARAPKPEKFSALFALYVIMVGPVLYFALKSMGRRKLFWLMVPLVSLLFTGGVYVLSINEAIHNTMLNAVVVNDYDETMKKQQVCFELQHPKTADYEVELDGAYTGVKDLQNYNSYGMFGISMTGQGDASCLLKESVDHTTVEVGKMQAFSSIRLRANHVEASRENINLNIVCLQNGMEGTIENKLPHDLKNAVIMGNSYIAYIPLIKSGETASFGQAEILNGVSPADLYNLPDLACPNLDRRTEDYMQLEHMADLVGSINSLSSGNGLFFAIEDGADIRMTTNKKIVESYETVALKQFPIVYGDVNGVYIPNIHANNIVNMQDWDVRYGTFYSPYPIEQDYDFRGTSIRYLYNHGVVHAGSGDTEAACYIYNQKTGDWELMFAVDSIRFALLDEYWDGTVLHLKYEKNQDTDVVPVIAGGEE